MWVANLDRFTDNPYIDAVTTALSTKAPKNAKARFGSRSYNSTWFMSRGDTRFDRKNDDENVSSLSEWL